MRININNRFIFSIVSVIKNLHSKQRFFANNKSIICTKSATKFIFKNLLGGRCIGKEKKMLCLFVGESKHGTLGIFLIFKFTQEQWYYFKCKEHN